MVIAALPIAIVAFIAILVLLAFTPLQRIIVALVAELPVVGGWIVQNSTAAIDRAYAKVVGWALAAVGPLVAIIFLPFFYLDHFNKAAQASSLETMYALRRVVDNVIPRTYRAAIQFAWDVGQNALHFAWDVGQNAMHFAWDVGQNVTHYAEALVARAVSYSEELFNRATAYSRQLYVQAVQNAEALALHAEDYARALFGDAVRFAQGVEARAADYAGQLLREAEDYARALQRETVRWAAGEVARVQDYARALFDTANAAMLAQVAAVALRVARIEASKCQQFCSPLGDLGSDLQDLEAVFAAGALFALAGAAAHDPRGWAREVVADLAEPLREAASSVLGETGVQTRAA